MKPPRLSEVLATLILSSIALLPLHSHAQWLSVYTNAFESTVGTEWSSTQTETTPVGGRKFLGQFGNQIVTLSVSNLSPHSTMRISFDLFIIRSWDGNGNVGSGPDMWSFGLVGGPTLLNTTFSMVDPAGGWSVAQRQSYPDAFPTGDHPARTGSANTNTLGYLHGDPALPADSVYRLEFTIPHTSSSTALQFSASGLQGIQDESWGIDNFSLAVGGPPLFVRFSEVELCWPSRSNALYQVDYRSVLESTNAWVPLLTNVVGNGDVICVYDKIPAAGSQRYYRLISP